MWYLALALMYLPGLLIYYICFVTNQVSSCLAELDVLSYTKLQPGLLSYHICFVANQVQYSIFLSSWAKAAMALPGLLRYLLWQICGTCCDDALSCRWPGVSSSGPRHPPQGKRGGRLTPPRTILPQLLQGQGHSLERGVSMISTRTHSHRPL
jgi:hypothetical protein